MKSCRKAGPWKDIAKSSIKSSQKQVLDAVPLLVAPVSILEASTRLGLPAGEFSGSPTVPTDKSPAIGPDKRVARCRARAECGGRTVGVAEARWPPPC